MRRIRWAGIAGMGLQGLILGTLLFLALLTLVEMRDAARLFRYQGF